MKHWVSMLACGLALLGVACGGDDDEEDNTGTASGALTQSNADLCAAQETGGCAIMTVAECADFANAVAGALDAACQDKVLAANTCQLANDACTDAGCESEVAASQACFGS